MHYSTHEDPRISYDKVTNHRKVTGLHYHKNHELYYLVNGKTKYFVGDEVFVLEKGNLIFVPAQVLHRCDSEDTLNTERILLSIPDEYFDKNTLPIFNELKECNYIYIPPQNLYIVDELLNKIFKEYKKEKPYKETLIMFYILELLALICRLKTKHKLVLSKTDEIIKEIIEYIRQNFSSPLSLGQLSHRFGLSDSYLSRQFKAVTGIGLNDFITYVRISNAEKILAERKLSMTELASLCGFNDSNYFATVFKKFKGVTPYKYSKTVSGKDAD